MSNQSERHALECLQIIEMKSIFNEFALKGFAEGGTLRRSQHSVSAVTLPTLYPIEFL